MKQFFTFVAALFMALLPAAAARDNDPDFVLNETRSYQVEPFDALEVSWVYLVELAQSPTQSVEVEAPDFVMPYLQVKVRNSCLILDVSGMPKDIRRKVEREEYTIRAIVTMPTLTKVEMSGASRLFAVGDFQANAFRMEMSGATSLKGLQMSADRANLQCSGASKFQIKGDLVDVKANLSGASKGDLESNGIELNLDLSGSSKLELAGFYDKAGMEASAATTIRMKGHLGALELTGSGAAKIDLMDCPIQDASLELSGAASTKIAVNGTLGVELSGGSSCQYKAGPELQIVSLEVSRGASLKRL